VIVTSQCRTVAWLACLLALATRALPDEPKPEAYEPKARELLTQVVRAYKDLKSYSDQGEIHFAATIGEEQKKQVSKRAVTFVRPNKLVMDYGVFRLVCDGKSMTFLSMPSKQYAIAPAPAKVDYRSVAQAQLPGNAAAFLFLGEGGLPTAVLLDLLASDDAAKSILEGTDGLRLEADRKLADGGKPFKSLLVDQSKGPDIRLLVDPENKLVARIEMVYNLDELNAKQPKEKTVKDISLAWEARRISDDAPEEAFATKPPDDFKNVEPAPKPAEPGQRNRAAVEEENNPVAELVGKPAPDFTLTVLDGPKKTRNIQKSNLAGKVVVVDFWATWCGPCLKELPEVQKLVDDFAREHKEVIVLAVSEDDDPSELPELRNLVEKTLSDKNITLADGPVGMVALDPTRTVGEAFKVDFVPTVVMIDAKGIVQAAHVGGKFDIRQVLTREIDTLLEGKPIPNEPPEAQATEPSKVK